MRARNYLFWVALGFSGTSAVIVLCELLFAFENLGVLAAWRGQLIALEKYLVRGLSYGAVK